MTSIRRYYIHTEIEACKREEIRKVLKRSLLTLSLFYVLIAIICFAFGLIGWFGMGNPELSDVEMARCSTILLTMGVSFLLMIALIIDATYRIWTEPTEKEKEEYGDRIV